MDTKLSRRERKKQATRQRLMEASICLFRQKGFDDTTVEEITEQADVAKGTFFNYFPSKEALLSDLALWGTEQLRAALDPSQGAPASPVARIKLLVRLMHQQIGRDMRFIHRAEAARLYHPPPPPHQARRRISGLFTDLVKEAQACGEMRADVDPGLVSSLLQMSFFRQMAICQADGDAPPAVEQFEQIIDLWMDGLAGPRWS